MILPEKCRCLKLFAGFIEEYNEKQLGQLLENELLSKHTTLRVGGIARVLVVPNGEASFIETVKIVKDYQLNFKIIGKGSNLLPSDNEYRGVIIKCDKGLDDVKIEGTMITAGAGISTGFLANLAAKAGLSGLEFISGIPASLGGAIYMNAGAYNKEVKDVLVKALIIDEYGKLRWLTNEDFNFSYRFSVMQQHQEWIVVKAILQLEEGNSEEIIELMKIRKERRKASQPLNMPSAGSTFRNPLPHASWKLIEDAGLRGLAIGGAEVSAKHCNFIVNTKNASATDILKLIQHVQKTVFEKYGIELHPEVEMFNWE